MPVVSETMESLSETLANLPSWAKAGIAIVGVAVALPLAKFLQGTRKSPYKADWEEGVVYLYQFPRIATVPNLSPFCVKLETWTCHVSHPMQRTKKRGLSRLRMAGVRYENVDCPIWLRSKEGMMPFVELNGVELHDSAFIMRDLIKQLDKTSTESHLTSEQRGVARAFEQMAENTTMQSYSLVRYGEHFEEMFSEKCLGKRVAAQIPLAFTLFSPQWLVSRTVKKRLEAHGIGRHSRAEVIQIGLDDLDAMSAYLGDKLYLTGTKPVRADATLFGLLSQLIWLPIDSPHTEHLHKHCGNLVAYAERIKANFWPDWEETCRTGDLHTDWKSKSSAFKKTPAANK